ncbi:Alpha/Beta hydrolase protein [Xylariales sp. PMI_506]|nr:Alpha/Beta hydrolase protein [Xylariales sp. PMI_506]
MDAKIPEGAQTLVYFTVDGHDVKFDYYLPRNASGKLPAVIYYHGGGMTAGSRRGMGFPGWMYDRCQEKGYIFISADYRLCHPCTTLDQIEDAKALFKFLAGDDFARALQPAGASLDTRRIAVTGFSAGAYSARAACVYAEPKPAALMTAFGLGGDLLLDHWTRGRPPTSIAKFVDLDRVPELLADRAVVSEDPPRSNRFALTVRWELDGTMLDNLFGRPGLGAQLDALERSARPDALPADLRPGFVQLFVGADYPPSVFVHGTADEVVSSEESEVQYEQLTQLGVKTELHLVENGRHGLMSFESGSLKPDEGSMEAYGRSFDFIVEAFDAVKE